MKFLILGDPHARFDRVEMVFQEATKLKIEGVLCVGDITDSFLPDSHMRADQKLEAERVGNEQKKKLRDLITQYFGAQLPFYYVPGNHDKAEGAIPRFNRADENADGMVVDFCGISLYGIGGAKGVYGWPYEWTEDLMERQLEIRQLKGLTERGSIILSHCPPYGSCDKTLHNDHIGSRHLAELATTHHGLFICGHCHEARGSSLHSPSCLVINGGAMGSRRGAPWLCVVDYDPTTGSVQVAFQNLENPGESEATVYQLLAQTP